MSLEIFESAFEDIQEGINRIIEWTSGIKNSNYFTNSTQGMMTLDAVVMRLQVIGELLKNVHKRDKEFLLKYPEVEWSAIMKMRDVISHHYNELNAEIIYKICKEQIPLLEKATIKVLTDLRKQLNSEQ